MLRVSKTGSGSGWGSCFLARRTSEWAPQPWSKLTARPSSLASPLAQTPKDSLSGPAIRTRKPQLRQWWGADWASGESGPPSAVVPPLRGQLAALDRQGAHPAQAEVLRDLADLFLVVGVEGVVAEGVRRDQPRVLVADREQVAG